MSGAPSRHAARERRPIKRLPGGAFDRVYKNGKRAAHRGLVLIVSAQGDSNSGGPAVRLGVVVGRNVARDAVPRNRLKRILRESFRIHADRLAPHPMDCILLARPPAASLKTRQEADGILEKLFQSSPQSSPARPPVGHPGDSLRS